MGRFPMSMLSAVEGHYSLLGFGRRHLEHPSRSVHVDFASNTQSRERRFSFQDSFSCLRVNLQGLAVLVRRETELIDASPASDTPRRHDLETKKHEK